MARSKPSKRTTSARSESALKPAADAGSEPALPMAIVGVGASAGGLEAFTNLLEAMPSDRGLAIVYVQHLSPARLSMLADILRRATRMTVEEVKDEPVIKPNHVYVIPPGRSMIVRGGILHLLDQEGPPHRAVDRFFFSLAEDQGHRAIGVVLSGTATDGTLGLEAIKAAGGITFAQDSTALHDGMPRSAVSSGCVDFVLAPAQIAEEIVALSQHLAQGGSGLSGDSASTEQQFDDVLAILRHESGVDFSQYKSNTLHRRIRRRMALQRVPSLAKYAEYLRSNASEVDALYQDILIGVTSFFRDAEAFETLKKRIFPTLFKDRSRHDPLRVWVLGCATGEEAYSLAIALKEYAAEAASQVPLIVYATDLNNNAIEKSRAGLYSKSIAEDVSPERLRRYFVEADGGYRISKAIRDICVFARQNVLADPPFSRMDFISCRNVLIYMEPALQKRLMPVLHYALKPTGFLFLGPSESLGGHRESFDVEDTRHKVFRKKPVATRIDLVIPPLASAARIEHKPGNKGDRDLGVRPEVQRDTERALLSRYVPAGVLVNQDFEILQFRGDTGDFLAPAPGRATLNLLKMVRDGLLVPLRTALQKALKDNTTVRLEGVKMKSGGGLREIAITAIPLQNGPGPRNCWLMFEPADPRARVTGKGEAGARRTVRPDQLQARDDQITHLTQELAATREYLQSVIEQQEAANEELQSANEEVQSANEELQSINEELETSKEEIQSSNEELITVNDELQSRNEQLNHLNNDLNNLFSSVQMAIVMLWSDLRIRRFTPLAERTFNLIGTDIGRPISDIKLKFDIEDLPGLLREVIESVTIREREVRDAEGRWYQLRVRPYKTFENKIDGAIVMLVDIDALKKNQEVLARQGELLEHTSDAVLVHDLNGRIQYWNRGAELLYGISRKEAVGKQVDQVLRMSPAEAEAASRLLLADKQWSGELTFRRDTDTIIVDAHRVLFEEAGQPLVLETHHDVTNQKHLEEALQRRVKDLAVADQSKNDFLAMLAHELRNPLAPLKNAVQILKKVPDDPELNRRTRELIERQVTNMVRMVDDLLDAARLTRGRVELQLENIELQNVISRSIDATDIASGRRGHRFSVVVPDEPVLVRGDATRLEQVFTNLLNNALKYTEPGGRISLTLVVKPSDGASALRSAVVHISDSGIGMAPEVLSHVFDLFAQADHSMARSQGGLGIGLNIVRNLVQLHGGEVSAHSAGPGLGSEFVVRLPVESSANAAPEVSQNTRPSDIGDTAISGGTQAHAAKNDRASRHGAARRVLVVDDSPDVVESTAMMLGLQGHAVQTVTQSEDALPAALRFGPDVVLLDIGMPGLDGYAIAREMRAQAQLKGIKLIAVSGYGTELARTRAKEAGFDHHFTKPLDLKALEAVLG